MYYLHVKAHQNDKALFANLSQKVQLNCICDHAAKQRIAINKLEGPILGWIFPLEPIGIFVNGKKMTLETGSQIRLWAPRQLACTFFHIQKILFHIQFNNIDWLSVHRTLHNLSHLFQIWAAKHVLGIAGTMKFLSHQDDRSPLHPSCLCCEESCSHVAQCPKIGKAQAFKQSAQAMELWLKKNTTHPDLQLLLLWYLHGRGSITCVACSMELNLPPIIHEFAVSQDIIGWDNFIMGMVSSKLLPIQNTYLLQATPPIRHSTGSWV
jgi:hypothetical protein